MTSSKAPQSTQPFTRNLRVILSNSHPDANFGSEPIWNLSSPFHLSCLSPSFPVEAIRTVLTPPQLCCPVDDGPHCFQTCPDKDLASPHLSIRIFYTNVSVTLQARCSGQLSLTVSGLLCVTTAPPEWPVTTSATLLPFTTQPANYGACNAVTLPFLVPKMVVSTWKRLKILAEY